MSHLTSKHFLHAKFVLLSTLVVFCIFGGITGNSPSQAFAQVDESDVKYFSQSDKTIVHSHVSIFESFDIYGTLYDDNNDGGNNDTSQSDTKTNTLTTASKHTMVFINDGDYSLSKQQLDYTVEYVTDQIQDNALLLTRNFMKSFSVLESFDISSIASNIVSPWAYATPDNIQPSLSSENTIPWGDDIYYFFTESFVEIGDIRINSDGTISASLVNTLVLASLLPVSFVVFVGRYNVPFSTLEKNIYISRNSTLKKSLTMFFVIILLSSSVPLLNFSNPSAMFGETEMLPEAYAVDDSTPPEFSSSALDTGTGTFNITFDETINHSTITPTAIHIRENNTSTGGITLSASELFTTANSPTISFTLSSAHLDLVNALDTPTLYIDVSAVQDISGNNFAGSAFDVTSASFVASFSVNNEETIPQDLVFSPDGTKMFVLGSGSRNVTAYTLTVPFDVTSASFTTGNSFSVRSQESFPYGLAFSPDGTKMFVTGEVSGNVTAYTLPTAFDVTSASFTIGDSFSVRSQVSTPSALAFSPDGTKMFVTGVNNGNVTAYDLSVAFDVTTASFTIGDSFSVSDQESATNGLSFSSDGTKMFVVGRNSDNVHEYTLTVPFNVTSASFTLGSSFPVSNQDDNPTGLAFSPDGTKMFVVGRNSNNVHEYNLSPAYTITLVGNSAVSSTESLSLSDTVVILVMSPKIAQLTESLSLSDSAGIMSNNMIPLTESLSLSDGITTLLFQLIQPTESLSISDTIRIHNPIDSTFGNNVGFDDTTPWIDDLSFQYRRAFTIDADNVPGSSNLADFAVMISLNASQGFDTIMQSHMNNDGSDLRFADNLGNLLPYEIEKYDESANQMIVWVKSNSTGISPSIDTSIYMYYGNFAATSAANSASVWNDDYKVVFHFDDNVDDSTINDNDGTNNGSMNTAGLIGNARDFDGIDDRIYLPNTSLNFDGGDLTLSLWMNTDVDSGNHVLIGKSVDSNHNDPYYRWLLFQAGNQYSMRIGATAQDLSTTIPADTWKYYVGAFDTASNEFKLYVDGDLINTTDTDQELVQSSRQPTIGGRDTDDNPNAESYDGQLDEVRISSAVKSAHWIKTEFNNQNSPSTFYDIGDEIKLGTIFDTITLADTVIKTSSHNIPLTESLSLLDSAGIMSNNMIQLTESLSLSDTADIMSNNMIQSTESLFLDDTIIGTLSYNEIHLTETLSLSDGMRLIDTTPPEFSNAALNEGTGVFDITFSEIVNHTIITPTAIHIRENNTSTGGLTLSISEYTTTANSDTISFTLNSTQLDLVNALDTPVLYMDASAVQDIRGNNFAGSAFDVTTASPVASFSVIDQDTSPRGLAFSPDGTKMFVVGAANDNVTAYDLSTAFNVATANFTGNFFSVATQEADPFGLAFSPDGTKMFVVGVNSGNLTAYDLSTAFNVTTANFTGNFFSVNAQVSGPSGLAFSPDGTKMFVVGFGSDNVTAYDLSTAFNVTTANFTGNFFSVATQEGNPYGLAFSPDGTKMFVVGFDSDSVNEYDLSTAFDITTANFTGNFFSLNNEERVPQGLAFSPDGTKMFVVGVNDKRVYEYDLSTAFNITIIDTTPPEFSNAALNEGTGVFDITFNEIVNHTIITPTAIHIRENNTSTGGITLSASELDTTSNSDTIYFTLNSTHLDLVNALDTPTLYIDTSAVQDISGNNFVGSAFNITIIDMPPEFSSSALNVITGVFNITFNETIDHTAITPTVIHIRENNTSTGGITLSASELDTTSNSDTISFTLNSTHLDLVNALDTPTLYIDTSAVQDIRGNNFVGSAFDVTTASFVDSFSVRSQESFPTGLAFSPDGTKMFVVGLRSGNVTAYTLSVPFNVTSANFTGNSFPVNDEDNIPNDLVFSPDGTKMFVAGNDNNNIHEYNLSTAFDVTTASFTLGSSFSVNDEETSPTGLAFSPDGTKMFVTGETSASVNEYTLSVPFNVTSASFTTGDSFPVNAQNGFPSGLVLSPDGTKMFVIDESSDNVYEYDLTVPFNVTSASFTTGDSFPVSGQDVFPSGLVLSPDGTKMFVIGTHNDNVNEYDLTTAFNIALIYNPKVSSAESLSLSDSAGIIVMSNNLLQLTESLFLDDTAGIMSNNMIQTTETLSLDDSAIGTLSYNEIHLTETLSITDTAGIMSNNMIQTTETLYIDDSAGIMSNNMIQTTETLYLDDSAIGTLSYNEIHLTETLSLDDSAGIMSNNMIQTTETLSLDDSAGIMSNNMIQTTETLSLDDSAIGTLSYNEIHLTETLSLDDSAGIMSNNMIQTTETLSLDDSAGIMSNNMIQTTETLSLDDSAIGTLSYNEIHLTETLSLDDSAGIMSNNMIQTTETLSLDDSAGIMSNNMIQTTETLSLDDSAGIMSNNMIQTTETLSLDDSAGIMSNNMIQTTETLSLDDSTGIMSNNMIQTTETLSLDDSAGIMSNNMIQTTETLSLDDSAGIMSNNMIQTTETLSLDDSTGISVMSNNMIHLTETLSLDDSAGIMSNNMIQTTETLSLDDSAGIMSNNMIQTTETLSLDDSAGIMSNNMIQTTETLSLDDSAGIMSNNMIQTTETLSLDDSAGIMSNNMIQTTETLSLDDSAGIMSNNMIQTTETLSLDDSAGIMSNNMIQTTETLSLDDSAGIMSNNMIQTTETLSLDDSAGIMSNNMIQTTETLSLDDSTGISVMSNNMIHLTETLSLDDSAGIMSNNMIQTTETLSLDDSAGIMSNNMIQTTETLSLDDSAGIMSNNMIQTTETLSLDDSAGIMSNNMIQTTETLSLDDSAGIMSNNMIQTTETLSLDDSAGIMSNNMIQTTETLSLDDSAGIMSNNMIQTTETLSLDDSAGIMSNNMIQTTETLSLDDSAGIMSNNMIPLTESLSLSDSVVVLSGKTIIKIFELLLLSDHTVLPGVSTSDNIVILPYAQYTSTVKSISSGGSSSASGSPHHVIDIAPLDPSSTSVSSTGLTITITTTRGDTTGLFSDSHGTLAVIKSTTDISRDLDTTLVPFGDPGPSSGKTRASDYYIIDDISGNIVDTTISMSYNDSLIDRLKIDESTLTIYKRFDVPGSNWIELHTMSHDTTKNVIVAENDGFSTYTLGGDSIPASTTPTPTNRGGGGSSIRGPALESGQSAVLYEVSWDAIDDDSTLLSIIAGPDSDAISIKIRTPESGVLYTQRAESQPYSDGNRVLYEVTIPSSNDFVVVYVEAVSQRNVNVAQNLINLYDASGTVIITEYVQDDPSKDSSNDSSDVTPDTIQEQLETIAPIDTPRIILDDLLKLLYITEYDGINAIQYDYLTLQTVPDNYAKVYHNIDDQYTTAVSLINSQTGNMEIVLQVSHTDDKVNSARIVYLGSEVTIKVSAGADEILVDSASMIHDVTVPDGVSSDTLYTTMNLKSQIAPNDENSFKSVMSHMSITNENTAEQLKYYTILQQQPKTDSIKSYSVSAMPDRYGDVDGANSDLNLILVLYEGDDDSTVSARIAHMGDDTMTVLSENNDDTLPYTQSTEIPLYPNTSKDNMTITSSCGMGDLELENGTCMTPEPGTFTCLPDQVMNHDGACIDK